MSSFEDLAARVVRRWVRRYTRGLDPAVREVRRAEIESDVWEHRREAAAAGLRPRQTGLEILARMVLGMPADIGWRRAMPRAEELGVEADMDNRIPTVWMVPAAIVAAGLNLVLGIAGWDPGWIPPQPSVDPFAVVLVVVGVAGLIGVVLRNRLPKVSGLLMLSGAWAPLFLGISSLVLGDGLGTNILNVLFHLVAIAAGALTIVGAIQTMTRRPALKQGQAA
jgi:hypothetical protein